MRRLGIDIGVSTIKLALVEDGVLVVTSIARHYGRALDTLRDMLGELGLADDVPVVTTGGGSVALLGCQRLEMIPAIVAGAKFLAPEAGCVIEIGSQGARFITGLSERVPQFAVNEHCAGGTGSFFEDQMSRLGMKLEDYSAVVAGAASVPRLSGRCAVFAKTDIIHRQQEGVSTPDILLGLCFAMVGNYKATIVRQLPVAPPVVFLGGVTRNAGMERAITEVFGLAEGQLLMPEAAEFAGAIGAALEGAAADEVKLHTVGQLRQALADGELLRSKAELAHALQPLALNEGTTLCDPQASGVIPADGCALGIDIGSTSTDLVLTARDGSIVDFQYLRTAGDPEGAVRRGLASIRQRYGQIELLAVGVTGSGRDRLGRMMGADAIRDEITAQAKAATFMVPQADTVFEIGGQDSKYISLRDGQVADFQMNKICAAGTGSFVEEQATRMNLPLGEFGQVALASQSPESLGDRCTVFIETAIAQAEGQGATKADIAAGLCYSIVHNYLHKVAGNKPVGEHIVLQGGVAYNPGIVAAFQKVWGSRLSVSPVFAISGAFGASLLALEAVPEGGKSQFKGFDFIAAEQREGLSSEAIARNREFYKKAGQMVKEGYNPNLDPAKKTVGVPLVLIMFKFFPLVNAFFTSLGYNVLLSELTSEETIRLSQQYARGETCYPVKLIYGHMQQLADKGVDYIFLPNIHTIRHPHSHVEHNYACPYMQTAARSIFQSLGLKERGITLIEPVFDLDIGVQAMAASMVQVGADLGHPKPLCVAAMMKGGLAVRRNTVNTEKLGEEFLASLKPEDKVLVLITRNYGVADPVLNMGLPELLLERGCKVITLAHLPGMSLDISGDYPNMYWPFGDHLLSGAKLIRNHPNLYAVYLTNHGCGPDTLVSHMFREEMGDKPYLQLEVDEHFSKVGVITRIEAFLNSISHRVAEELPADFDIKNVSMKLANITASPEREKVLYIPDLGCATPYLRLYYEGIGVKTRVLRFDNAALRAGRAQTNSKEYLPFVMLVGATLEALKGAGEDAQFLLPFNRGADADGQYARALRTVLNQAGFENASVVAPMTEELLKLEEQADLMFRVLMAGDLCYLLPADERVAEKVEAIPTWEQLRELATRVAEARETLVEGRAHRIGVVGTPLTVTALDGGILERLESEGSRVCRMPLSEYLWFLLRDNATKGDWAKLDEIEARLKSVVEISGPQGPFALEPAALVELADRYLPGYAGANGRYRFAKALALGEGCGAVLALAPRYENTAMVMELRGLAKECPAPLLSLALDGDWDEAQESHLKSFLYYLD